jgi:hypothetical protein
MSKPVRIKAEEQPKPNLRKLARALLLLVEEQSTESAAVQPKRKAS